MNVISVLLFMTVNLFLFNEASHPRELRLNIPSDILKEDNPSYYREQEFVIKENKELKIVLANQDEDVIISDPRCRSVPDDRLFDIKAVDTGKDDTTGRIFSVLNVLNDNSNTCWVCNFKNQYDKVVKVFFAIRVKRFKEVPMNINGVDVKFSRKELPEKDTDGLYEYSYEEGVTIDLTCKNKYEEGNVTLRYYDAQGTNIVTATRTSEIARGVDFRQLMRSEHDGSFIECTYLMPQACHQYKYTYRTGFTKKHYAFRTNNLIVTVNDRKLTEYKTNEYQYNFKFGEILQVTCEVKHKSTELHMKLDKSTSMKLLSITPKTAGKLVTGLVNSNGAEFGIVRCYSGSEDKAKILFTHKNFQPDPIVQGMPSKDLLYEYSKDNYSWEAHYQYAINDVLNLTCTTVQNRTLQWVYGGKTNTFAPTLTSGSRNIYYKLTLNDKHNGTSVTCEATKLKEKTTRMTVIFHQKLENIVDVDAHPLTFMHMTILAIIVCTSVVVIAIACCVCCWCGRKNRAGSTERLNENFQPHNNHTPAPSELNQYEYAYGTNMNHYVMNDHHDRPGMVHNTMYESIQDYANCGNQNTELYTELDKIRPSLPLPYEMHDIDLKEPTEKNNGLQENGKAL